MSLARVGVELYAKDKASRQLSKFNKNLKGLSGTMRSMAGAFGLGLGLYGVVRGFKAVVGAASDAEEIHSKFMTVFKEYGEEAKQWSEDFGDSVGRATQDVEEWMGGLQDTFVPLGFARDEAFELSKQLTKLAVDVASFNNESDPDVINAFTSAMVGNHMAVRKYGIVMTAAALAQEAMNMGFTEGWLKLKEYEKAQVRMSLIMKSTTDAQGDAVRTADSYANQVKRLSSNWLEFKQQLGEKVLPALAAHIKHLNENEEALDSVADGIGTMIGLLGTLAGAYGKVVGASAKWSAQMNKGTFGSESVLRPFAEYYAQLSLLGTGQKLDRGFDRPLGGAQRKRLEEEQIEKDIARRERNRLQHEKERIADEKYLVGVMMSEMVSDPLAFLKPAEIEGPDYLKKIIPDTIELTEAQTKAQTSMYGMMMKAKGLGDELARQKKITDFSTLAIERYGPVSLAAAQAINEFTISLKANEVANKAKETSQARTDALRDMYGSMREMTQTNFGFEVSILDQMREEYKLLKVDQNLIDQWYNEQWRELEFRRLEDSENFVDGFRGATGRMEEDMITWADVGKETADTLQSSFKESVHGMVKDGDSLGDSLGNIFLSIAEKWHNMVLDMAAEQMFQTIIGGGTGGGAGWLGPLLSGVGSLFSGGASSGVGNIPRTPVTGPNPWAMTTVQHGGEVLKTGLAIVHEGEVFSGTKNEMGFGRGSVTVNIINQSGEKLNTVSTEDFMKGDEHIVDVIVGSYKSGGAIMDLIDRS